MKILSEFPKDPKMADGHANKCKVCTKRDDDAKHPDRQPAATDPNRSPEGKFVVGNSANPGGNPLLGQAQRCRAIFQKILTDEILRRICDKMVAMSLKGNLMAVRELLDRSFGKTCSFELLDWMEKTEQLIQARLNAEKPAAEPAQHSVGI